MMQDVVTFLALQRSIFGLCPCCGALFRLSDCRVYLKSNPPRDWMTLFADNEKELALAEAASAGMEDELRSQARAKGRKSAQQKIKIIDRVFSPRRLHADDAKVLLHPIDYIVFQGMNSSDAISSIVLLDRISAEVDRRKLQQSLEKTVELGNYEWVTLRVTNDGCISRS